MAVVVTAVFMTNLDLWIVNVALPTIGTGFSSGGRPPSLADLSWVLNGYAVGLAALLVAAGRLGDRIGHRRVFLAGVVVFTVSSGLCALAPNLPVLIAARVLQAAGAAAQLPTSLALLMVVFPPERRMAAARAWSAVGALAAAAGPVIGGLLVVHSWRWVFLVNLPVGLLSLLAGLRVLPHPPAREREPWPDLAGAALVTVAVGSLTGALVQAPVWGWSSAATLALLGLAAAATALFLRRSAVHRSPLFELSLFRVPGFGLANTATFVFGAGFSIMLLSDVLWCQEIWHYSPLRTGLALAPGPAMVPVVTLLSSRAVRRRGSAPVVALGSALFAVAMLIQAGRLHTSPSYLTGLLPSMLIGGAGVGLAVSTLIAAGVTALPAQRSATGSAMINAGRQIASAVGVALLVTLVGVHIDAASRDEFRLAWLVAALLGVVTGMLALGLPRPGAAVAAPTGVVTAPVGTVGSPAGAPVVGAPVAVPGRSAPAGPSGA
ncbi:MFS transporter [Jatrophihabitans sp.]|uniref:MFS transporter n=1 Tax=Jatrophihabitans sp. TaxID=1932789 RepID=UPI002BF2C3F4|nr:MFS transporter [Jatrophihabitans sp.]